MTHSLNTRIQQHVVKHPDKPALIYPGQKTAWEILTYRQLAGQVELFSRGLAGCGLRPGMRAVMMLPPSVDFFALVFAMLESGIVPVMVDPAIGLSNVTPCIAECEPYAYFGSTLTHIIRRLFGWGRNSLQRNLTLDQVQHAGHAARKLPSSVADPQSEAAIVYTSGSTGLPKGAIFTHLNFSAQIEMLVNALQLHGDEIDLPAFPLFALIDCLLGVTAVIPDMRFPAPARVDPAKMVDAIQTHKVETMFVSPVALARLSRYCTSKHTRLTSLQKVITAGAPAPVEVQSQFVDLLSVGSDLYGIYGSTETLPVTIINSREILQETCYLSLQGAGVCIGKPVEGAHVRIIPISDADMSMAEAISLPVGEIGEIAVNGAAVTEKYVERKQNNRLAKIISEDGKTIHRMGDIGYFDNQGRLWYCGRKSQRVVTPTGTLFTEMVEGVFNAHPKVFRTALVDAKKSGETAPVLWVELNPECRHENQDQIRTELLALGKEHTETASIRYIFFHPTFPTDVRHNSKILREKLAVLAKERL